MMLLRRSWNRLNWQCYKIEDDFIDKQREKGI